MVKIASFNVENLFARPKAFRATDFSVAEPVLEAYGEVNELIKKPSYSAADKARIRDLLVVLDTYTINSHGAVRREESLNPRWARLRKNRGEFDRQPQDPAQSVEIIAGGRGDWIGWIELATEPTNEIGTRMTARVIQEIDADILAVIEAEDRPSLARFNDELLAGMYRHIMLIDGNDERGIDVAIMTRAGFDIESIRSNLRFLRPAQPARLHLHLEEPAAVIQRGAAVSQRTLGRPRNPSDRLGDLRGNDKVRRAGLRPRRGVRRARCLTAKPSRNSRLRRPRPLWHEICMQNEMPHSPGPGLVIHAGCCGGQ